MSAGTIGIEGALTALDEARGTLSLRAWMERHRAEILRHCDGRRIDWVALCRWFTEVGLVNARGLAPTVKCAKMMWYRVGKWMAARKERADVHATEAQQTGPAAVQVDARRSSPATDRRTRHEEDEHLRNRMAEAERAAAWAREKRASDEAAALQQKRQAEFDARKPIGAAADQATTPPGQYPKQKILSDARGMALPPCEEENFPPAKKGEISGATGHPWKFDDLPGYPSKWHFEYELDWVRVVSRMLRERHETNRTMTMDEEDVVMCGQSYKYVI
ncbi:hypothetical protein KSAC_31320 (plasmid) [Komagataeibacter saccharivorans]|uniref:hypothetical protein n=1 Tax=Komagataeibacter saccharivorans TaxID=265959 RepID=UPI00104F4D15|nr:hypothetical protein [Komagataeibacter saccharivorans]QBL95311.1 hypothetical protein KSAC_31320 [Komagataeibacter saccharivorans]